MFKPVAPFLPSFSRSLTVVYLLSGLTAAAATDVKIEGLRGDLLDAARVSLEIARSGDRKLSAAERLRLFESGREEIRRSLEAFGYYNARVDGELVRTQDGFEAKYRVTLGDPAVVRRSSVRVAGEAAEMPAVKQALQRFAPAPGERFDHARYEESKADVANTLSSKGFLRATATSHRVAVSRKANTADIDLAWQSGPRLRFGPVAFSRAPFGRGFLERYVPWSDGDYYSAEQLLAFQQKLIAADYFSDVTVQPDLSNEALLEVPIDVHLAPARRDVYTASLFTSTDTGLGVSAGAKRRWLNDRAHKMELKAQYAERLEDMVLAYGVPLPGRDDRSLNLAVAYRDENTSTSVSQTLRTTANEARQWRGFTRTLGLQLISGTFEIAAEADSSTLLFAEATLSRKTADDFFFPRRGHSYTLGGRATPAYWVSDTSFAQLTADARWIYPAGGRQRLLLRGSLGLMAVHNFDRLPPELRFFTGGDRSVRGFAYEELGSTDAEGNVIGGHYLTVASIELERRLLPKWGAAVFVDGGDAFLGSSFKLNVGAGIGVRWRSPVGIVRLDVAKPVVSDLAGELRYHIVIGADL